MLLIHPATTILPVQPATALEKPKQDDTAKIVKSSREFESLLLGNWLQQAEESFAKVPGIDDEEEDAPANQFQGIAMQALGTAMTASGGIGLARMIGSELEHSGQRGAQLDPPMLPVYTVPELK